MLLFEGVEDFRESGARSVAHRDEVAAGEEGRRAELIRGDFVAAPADGLVVGEGALAGEQIEAVEFEEGVEDRLADEALERGVGHLRGVLEAHVLGGEGDDGVDDFVGVTEAGEDVAGDGGAQAVVAGEANAVLEGLGAGLADVVE